VGAVGPQGPRGYSSITVTGSEAAGANCTAGGRFIKVGVDDGAGDGVSDDGVLHPDEVDQTTYICDGVGPFILRFTRAGISTASSDTDKDAACAGEYGAGYMAAKSYEMSIYAPSVESWYFGIRGSSNMWKVDDVTTNDRYALVASTGGSAGIACISKVAPVRFTAADVLASATDSVKDAACTGEFGASYRAAETNDVMFQMKRIGMYYFVSRTLSVPTFIDNSADSGRYDLKTDPSCANCSLPLACSRI
jgi:hypothetical protein